MIGGVRHKLCTGPLHREGKFVPTADFYIRGNGRLRPQCKFCEGAYVNSEPRVPYIRLKFAVDELVNRLGGAEASRRIGIRHKTMVEWRAGRVKSMKRRIARNVIAALVEARRNNEARHRKSIKYGAAQRGAVEKIPRESHEFNNSNNDAHSARKRRYIQSLPEEKKVEIQEREVLRTARRRQRRLTTAQQ